MEAQITFVARIDPATKKLEEGRPRTSAGDAVSGERVGVELSGAVVEEAFEGIIFGAAVGNRVAGGSVGEALGAVVIDKLKKVAAVVYRSTKSRWSSNETRV